MTFAATRLIGRLDPAAVFEGLAADLLARGALTTDQQAAARASVEAGRIPATALIDVGAPAEQVLRALSVVAGVPPAPASSSWDLDMRARLNVSAATWHGLMAIPIGTMSGRPLVAFADVQHLTSSGVLALPDHVPCVALERDVQVALMRAPDPGARPLAFLAPPSAVVQGMDVVGGGFGAGSTPGLAGTVAGPSPATPAPHASSRGWPGGAGGAGGSSWPPPVASTSPFSSPHHTPGPGPSQPFPITGAEGLPGGTHVISGAFDAAPPGAFPSGAPAPSEVRVTTSPLIGPGARIGNYVVERRLGEGGMATVYVGVRASDGAGARGPERVAIKVVHEHLLRSSSGNDLRRRFQREVAAMRQLDHPGIVACIDAGQHGESEYLVSEFMSGGSLAALLATTGKLPPMLVLAWFGDLLAALEHAHARGVVHRDLKPDNLLLDAHGRLKIADFGIARLVEGTQLTAAGGIVGTPSYMSPEQALASPVDQRADLYAAGLIAYEAIVGRNPFEDASVMAVLKNVVSNAVRPLGEVEPAVPLLVELVVGRLMSLRADDRYASASEVRAALEPVLARAQAARVAWGAVVERRPRAVEEAREREAAAHLAEARRALDAGQRFVAGVAAFRAVSLSPDHRDARAVLASLQDGAPPVRFARSGARALVEREAAVDRLEGEARRQELRALAQVFLDDGNPLFASHYGRRCVASYGVGADELADLARVLPAEELEDVRGLPARVAGHAPSSSGAAGGGTRGSSAAGGRTTLIEPWRPAASGAGPAPPGDRTVSLAPPPGAGQGRLQGQESDHGGGAASPELSGQRASQRRIMMLVIGGLVAASLGAALWQWVVGP